MFSLSAQVIKNPVTDHLPAGSLKIGTSYHSEQIVDVKKFAEDKPIVFVIGAMAHGKVLYNHVLIFILLFFHVFLCACMLAG